MAGRRITDRCMLILHNTNEDGEMRNFAGKRATAPSGSRVMRVHLGSSVVLSVLIVALLLITAMVQSGEAAHTPTTDQPLNNVMDTQNEEIFLPLVMKRWPPIPDTPVLNPINNPDGDGYYSVVWNNAYLAEIYVLQEADNASFSNPTERYSGTATAWNATGKSAGTYYYRVMASNSWGNSSWSNAQQVTVSPPRADVSVDNKTGGTLCYEVDGTGIGRKCFGSGINFYGSFPSGTYTWHASAPCGSASGTEYYEPGEFVHEFWCE